MTTQNSLTVLKAGIVAGSIAPFLASAAVSSDCASISSSGLVGLFGCANGLIIMLLVLLDAVALLLFLWGVTKFLSKADDQKAREEGRQFMIWGIIALFVISAAIPLAGVISRTFGFSTGQPQLNQYNSSTGNDYANSRVNLVPPGSSQAVY